MHLTGCLQIAENYVRSKQFYPVQNIKTGFIQMHPEQKKSYQAMTTGQKLQLALALYNSAVELKAAGLKALHPDWTEDTIKKKARDIFLYAGT
jgi:hypothetical protein